jgi:peptide/nickel transport system substrate-binding protein
MANFLEKILSRRRAPSSDDAHRNFDRRLVVGMHGRRLPSFRQVRQLPRFLSGKEKLALQVMFAAAALSFFAAGTKFISDHVKTIAADGGDYVEATVGAPHLINPILLASNDADIDLTRLMFSGLLRTDESGKLKPDLAKSYEVSADGKVYTFHLRPNLVWQDGAPVKASDVAFTYNATKNPAWRSPLQPRFRNVTVEAPDDATVTFTLPEPFAPFASFLTVGVLPEHLWSDIKPEAAMTAELNLKPVGTGPFKFKNLVKDKKGSILSYTLIRNEAYYWPLPHLNTVTLKFYADFAAATDALTQRRVDGLSYLPDDFLDEVIQMRTITVRRLRVPQYVAVFLNPNRNPILKNKAVRQALAYAIDRETLVKEAARSGSMIVDGPLMPNQDGYSASAKRYTFNAAQAAQLLDEAGWKTGPEGTRVKASSSKGAAPTPLAITLTTVDTKENSAVAHAIAKAWGDLGVKADLEILPPARFQKDKIQPRAYDALLYGVMTGIEPDPYPFWHSSQTSEAGLNLALWQSQRGDDLLEAARAATTAEARAAAYGKFQELLAEDEPAIFLYSPSYNYAVNRRFRGLNDGTVYDPADRFVGINQWYVETKRVWEW